MSEMYEIADIAADFVDPLSDPWVKSMISVFVVAAPNGSWSSGTCEVGRHSGKWAK